MLFRPAKVHAQQHVGPVLGIGSAGAGIDGDDGVVGVLFSVQHHIDGKLVDAPLQRFGLLLYLGQGMVVLFLDGHGQQQFILLQGRLERLKGIDAVAENSAFL
jgi:hypothetical protein